jgi:hypothetical protein
MNHNGDDAPPNTDPQTAFTELGAIVLGAQPLDQVLERVAELSQQAIPGAGAVSVTLLDGDQHDQEDQAYEFEHAHLQVRPPLPPDLILRPQLRGQVHNLPRLGPCPCVVAGRH